MEIPLLKSLLNSITSVFKLASCESIKCEPVQEYHQTIEDMLKLLKPILDAILDVEIPSDELLQKEFTGLCQSIDDLRETFENWQLLMSKVYFVLQVESLMEKIQTSSLEILELLNICEQCLPAELSSASLENCVLKIKNMGCGQKSEIISKAVKDHVEGLGASSESLAKISDSLGLKSNQELLIEAVALEKLKENAEQAEKTGEVEYIDQMIALIIHMHDLLVMLKQSETCNPVAIPADFCCPLSLELMTDPVIVASGQTYERAFIRNWIDLGLTVCPKTRQTLAHTNLIPNYTVKALIANWCELNNVKLPDPVKSISLNQPSSLLANVESGGGGRANHSPSPDPTMSLGSPRKNSISYSGTQREASHLNHPRSLSEDSSLRAIHGNGLDVERISSKSFDDRLGHSGERSLNSECPLLVSSSGNSAVGADEQLSPGHTRTNSVSSTLSNYNVSETPGDGNEVASDAAAYVNDASGVLTSEPQLAAYASALHREPDFPSRQETRSRVPTVFRRPSERFVPRVVCSSAVELRADLLEVETQVKKLVEDLKTASLDIQRNATAELRLLAKHNMDNRIVIAKCGAISLLVNLLLSSDLKIQENAVTAILNLSINDNNKNAIANADAIGPLIHVLETGSPEAKENSAATLFSLSVIEENKIKIGRSGAIKPLVDLLGNGTPRGKKDAATALFNLSIFHENKARIVQAGAVKYLIELMDPAAGMVDKAVAVLSNLSTIHEGRIAIGQEGGIPVLVEVAELGSGRGKENAAAALLQLSTNSGRFCNMVLQEGAVPPLVALSQSGTPRAREKAQELLRYFRNQRHGNASRR
ncbi:U-box domain-containing protein 4-like isoform X2 [Olea europaea var. sylvestris]|nr:U-box domain-containing protein 4-like isoform X2 [Olea europaea var. sylvestris]XP_022893698.1 U-box domain-containing protein 4-like isoform X2 [Olea europaea var. sylvestris]